MDQPREQRRERREVRVQPGRVRVKPMMTAGIRTVLALTNRAPYQTAHDGPLDEDLPIRVLTVQYEDLVPIWTTSAGYCITAACPGKKTAELFRNREAGKNSQLEQVRQRIYTRALSDRLKKDSAPCEVGPCLATQAGKRNGAGRDRERNHAEATARYSRVNHCPGTVAFNGAASGAWLTMPAIFPDKPSDSRTGNHGVSPLPTPGSSGKPLQRRATWKQPITACRHQPGHALDLSGRSPERSPGHPVAMIHNGHPAELNTNKPDATEFDRPLRPPVLRAADAGYDVSAMVNLPFECKPARHSYW